MIAEMELWLHTFSFPQRVAELGRRAEECGFAGILVAGPAEEVRDRPAEIGAAGIDRLIVVPGSLDADRAALEDSNRRFAREVLPALGG